MDTISKAIEKYIEMKKTSRSENTAKTYRRATNALRECLLDHGIDPDIELAEKIDDAMILWFIDFLQNGLVPSTISLYLTATTQFYEFLATEEVGNHNLTRIRGLIKQRTRRPSLRLPQFPKDEIEKVIDYAQDLVSKQSDGEADHLRNMRDRAFILALADTGLRVHEACSLKRGDIDWNEGHAIIVGKCDKESV